ncbi:prolyl 3-hydroxylase /prolyl 3,4-dihydroxylase, partial [Lecanoromycetidae sp. Uapishka_2]
MNGKLCFLSQNVNDSWLICRTIRLEERFREGLFHHEVLEDYRNSYAASKPYRHGVISDLISSKLLRDVRSEIQNLSFTPKETDIYKIHQSGDLANLDGLDDSSLKLLPSLLTLRDAMYSSEFRQYLSTITDSGPLSGKKTDMAINVYTPGCHLLCHDDVIGSRRVSYILYLTDPDKPWQKEWGGALRLYPTQTHVEEDGQVTKVPSPDYSVSIPPAFNQLSFFAVQPGESFHDVEEVYDGTESGNGGESDARVRMAISGWYHIPQEGEDGFAPGLEDKLAEKSSLVQLQGKGDNYDLPKENVKDFVSVGEVEEHEGEMHDQSLSEEDLTLLLKYLKPTYLTPDTVESVAEIFGQELSHDCVARRFRRGQDYTLATGYEENGPRIELCLGITPTLGWGGDKAEEAGEPTAGDKKTNAHDIATDSATGSEHHGVGGYLAYMAGDDDDEHADADEAGSDHGVEVPLDMSTGARSTRAANPGKSKQDPAIYQASGDEEDDGVLFSMPADWNRLGVVLRDKGTMRFVKYVSRMAKGDRWDLVGNFGIVENSDDSGDEVDPAIGGEKVDNGVNSDATTSIAEVEGGGNDNEDDEDDDGGRDEESSGSSDE